MHVGELDVFSRCELTRSPSQVSFTNWDIFWALKSFCQSSIEMSVEKGLKIHVVASKECQTQGRILETRQHCDSRVSDNDYCLGSLHFGLYTRKGVLQTGTFPWKLLGELSSSQMNLDNNMRWTSGDWHCIRLPTHLPVECESNEKTKKVSFSAGHETGTSHCPHDTMNQMSFTSFSCGQ